MTGYTFFNMSGKKQYQVILPKQRLWINLSIPLVIFILSTFLFLNQTDRILTSQEYERIVGTILFVTNIVVVFTCVGFFAGLLFIYYFLISIVT